MKIVLALTLTLAALNGAGSRAAASAPAIWSQSGPTGWTALKIQSDGSPFSLQIQTPKITGLASFAAIRFNEDDEFVGYFWARLNSSQYGATLDTSGNVSAHVDTMNPGTYESLDATAEYNQSAQYRVVGVEKLLVWWAGNATWNITLHSGGGNSILTTTHGENAFDHRPSDFHSTAQAQAYASGVPDHVNVPTQGARATVQADLSVPIEHTLFAFYMQSTYTAGTTSVTTPHGDVACQGAPLAASLSQASECDFVAATGPGSAGPGTYTFHDTSAALGGNDETLTGADATLPA